MSPKNNDSFSKRTWRLFYPFWLSEHKYWAWGLSLSILGLVGVYVYLVLKLNYWSREFYNTFTDLDLQEFYRLLVVFAGLATMTIITFTIKNYLVNVLEIRWRRYMTHQFTQLWLRHHAYYGLQLNGNGTDNPDQRIQQDIHLFTTQTAGLFFAFFREFVLLLAFLGVLWVLSGEITFTLMGVEVVIHGYMCWAALLISVIGTFISVKVGRPLIRLDFQQEKREADFRYSLVRLRENVEGVALYEGEDREDAIFSRRFTSIVHNYYRIIHRMLFVNFWTSGYSQVGAIIPALLAAPKIFGSVIKFGGFMQILGAYRYVQDALSFIVDNFPVIASWKATTQRLLSFAEQATIIRERQLSGESKIHVKRLASLKNVEISDLHVELPNGEILFDDFHCTFTKGKHTLIIGPSGTGKSTLFRTIAGIWPYGAGDIRVPKKDVLMFLPQRPYMPLGTLGEVLCYPNDYQEVPFEVFVETLKKVNLTPLIRRVDDVNDWARVLSLGEQQRVAIARVLIQKPDWLFLDEATSAMEEKAEASLYKVLEEDLPKTTLVTIGHRSSLKKFHDHVITVKRKPHVNPMKEPEILVLE